MLVDEEGKDDPGSSSDWVSGKEQPAVRAPSQGQDRCKATPAQAHVQEERDRRDERWECDQPFQFACR